MSQVNHNASYLFVIDGITVWERLRVVRNFLTERRQALALAELNLEELDIALAKMEPDSYKYKKRIIFRPQSIDLIDDCKNEINFLEKLEKALMIEAEPLRIEGKTDKEMYEINYFREAIEIILLDLKSEIVATGGISKATARALIQNPFAAQEAVAIGLLSSQLLEEMKLKRTDSCKVIDKITTDITKNILPTSFQIETILKLEQ